MNKTVYLFPVLNYVRTITLIQIRGISVYVYAHYKRFLFSNYHLKELNGRSSFPLFEVAPSLTNLYEKLLAACTFQDRIELLETFLYNIKSTERTPSPIILNCVNQGIRQHGNLQAKELETHTGYSERYLRILFTNELGISPKTFFQLVNFQHIVSEIMKDSFNLETYLNNNDFYDSSHFYKTFKKMTKMTPGEYRKLLKETKRSLVEKNL